MYETLWRHFSPLGDIDDLNVIPTKGVSFIRYIIYIYFKDIKIDVKQNLQKKQWIHKHQINKNV